MSTNAQIAFLEKLHAELQNSSKQYRRNTSDKQFHHFSMRVVDIEEGLADFLYRSYGDVEVRGKEEGEKVTFDKQIPAFVDGHNAIIQKFVKSIRSKVDALPADKVIKPKGWNKSATGDFTVGFRHGKDANIYRRIYRLYSKELNAMVRDQIKPALQRALDGKAKIRGRDVANLSHKLFEGNLETFMANAVSEARKASDTVTLQSFKNWISTQTADEGLLEVIRDTKSKQMTVSVGSASLNADEGKRSQARKREFERIIKEALERLEATGKGLSGVKGSDSFTDIQEKDVLKAATEPFVKRKTKNTRVKRKPTQVKHSSTKVTKKVKGKSKVVAGPMSKVGSKKKGPAIANKGASSVPFELLLGSVNAKLPTTVAKNMVYPALNYRTGRFAKSVRAVDAVTTNKGFPSVGYTYMLNPYQTFEVGFAQGDPMRDPRKLIDFSIREIASQFLQGRFFTRRV